MNGKYFCCFLLMLYVGPLAFSQQPAKPIENKIRVGVDLFYYHPNISNLNEGFSKIESNLAFSRWKNFSIEYLVLPTITYNLDRKNQVAVQVGGSFTRRVRDDSKSYYYLWMVGGEYRYRLLSRTRPTSDIYVSLGTGMLAAKFYRSYGNDVGLYALGRKPYVNAGVAFCLEITKQIDVDLNARYMFVPLMKFNNLKSEVSLKSFIGGIGLCYSI